MDRITESQVAFIRKDLEHKGITSPDLLDDLTDHICCLLEEEWSEGDDFPNKYQDILSRFYKSTLSEIQEETDNLLRFKHFYSMIRTLNISGIATVIFTLFGALLKVFHLPGAAICIVLGGFLFSLVFLPLLIIIKFRDEDKSQDKVIFGFGFLLAMAISAGLIFKIMHWPGANVLMLGGTVLFTVLYVPLYFFTRFRRPELRFNTIVNTVLMFACGGIFFAMFDLSFSRGFSKQMEADHMFMHNNSEKLRASNLRLYENSDHSENAKKLHELSNEVNSQIEVIAAIIVSQRNTNNTIPDAEKLMTKLVEYNSLIRQLNRNDLKTVETSSAEVMERLSTEVAMNTLARMQQEIAVNETCYLSSRE